ncbi:MAG: DUF4874 domain-containing protein [Clostridiaceae bacterium]|jgi:hypothetical protein|nr:DUF4874 domain-containing protein [Clostridiaceae bacterium]
MKRKIKLLSAAAVILAVATTLLTACNKPIPLEGDVIEIPSSYAYELDGSVPFSELDTALLENPGRGLRTELYITLGANRSYPSSADETAYQRLESQSALYAPDKPQVAQVYVYLTEYYDRDLPDDALAELKAYFEKLQNSSVKMLLRFAYEYTEGDKRGPTDDTIEKHCKQLKAFFADNETLIARTLHAVQLGFVGLWGEGHGAIKSHDFTRVIKAVCDMTPSRYTVMVRTADIYMRAPEELKHRLTIHDDFIVGSPGHEWSLGIGFDDPKYGILKSIEYLGVCDGEMPWGRDTTFPNISHFDFLRQISDFGLTTLSATHNYKEDGSSYHLERWKSVYVTETELRDAALPFNPNLLTDGRISVYEYVRYHLGYQLAVSNFAYADGKISFMLTNFGFAAPYNFALSVVVNGNEIPVADFSPADLNRFGQKIYTVDCAALTSFGLKLTNTADASSHIKLANAIPYSDGVNVII